jgi:transposase-like protein
MRCEECRRYFTPDPSPNGYDRALKEQALRLCLEGMSFRAVGRQLGVHYQSVINWLNAHHEQDVPEQVEDTMPADTIEIDELYTFVGKKTGERTS